MRRFEATSEQAAESRCVCSTLPSPPSDLHSLRNNLTSPQIAFRKTLHMPSHLDIQVGDYRRAMEDNVRAYQADMRLRALYPSRFTIYTGYLSHNIEFSILST